MIDCFSTTISGTELSDPNAQCLTEVYFERLKKSSLSISYHFSISYFSSLFLQGCQLPLLKGPTLAGPKGAWWMRVGTRTRPANHRDQVWIVLDIPCPDTTLHASPRLLVSICLCSIPLLLRCEERADSWLPHSQAPLRPVFLGNRMLNFGTEGSLF